MYLWARFLHFSKPVPTRDEKLSLGGYCDRTYVQVWSYSRLIALSVHGVDAYLHGFHRARGMPYLPCLIAWP